jgi:1,4-dihydroxy-2-naphthoate octaprenyltransferase
MATLETKSLALLCFVVVCSSAGLAISTGTAVLGRKGLGDFSVS